MLRHIILFALLLPFACSVVHKFSAKTYRLEGEAAALRHEAIRKRHPGYEIREKLAKDISPSFSLNRTSDTYNIYIANITIGTPAVTYVAEIDLFYGSDLCVIGPNANLSTVAEHLPKKQVYNASKSSTYVNEKGNFTDNICGSGKNGSDKITVDGVTANVAMGIINKLEYYLSQTPVDAILGLNPANPNTIYHSSTNAKNLADQLLSDLDTPIMSWWQNATKWQDGVAQLTVGGEDTDNCQTNYVYAPQKSYWGWGDYGVAINSAKIEGTDYEVSLNTSTSYWPDQYLMYCPQDFFYVLTNASNAVYNQTTDHWMVDCDMSKVKDIVLNIGDPNNPTKLVLIGGDYIRYYYHYETCYISAYAPWHVVELSRQFANNHCVAYNAKDKTVGYADSKWKSNDPTYYW